MPVEHLGNALPLRLAPKACAARGNRRERGFDRKIQTQVNESRNPGTCLARPSSRGLPYRYGIHRQ